MPDNATVRVIAGSKSWIEGDAVAQLESTARLPGMRLAIGLPDLHAGRGNPIGAAFVSDLLYPHLVGNDIGCGISLWRTEVKARGFNAERTAGRFHIDDEWDGDTDDWLKSRGVDPTPFDSSLGTIGAGNHFAEVQRVASIIDARAFADAGLHEDRLLVMVHSGSRGLGESILSDHVGAHDSDGLETRDAATYIRRHDNAVAWGVANRDLIAKRVGGEIGAKPVRVLDLTHNSARRCKHGGSEGWLHRKGAAPSDQGLIAIPGSRGTPTYLVRPTGDQSDNAWSVAHGAGRKWTRTFARERLADRVSPQSLLRTELGSFVVCEDRTLLYEEAPQAYKDIDRVVGDLVDAGLVAPVAILHPVITYKTADSSGRQARDPRRERGRNRRR